jgi:hypothetical protein
VFYYDDPHFTLAVSEPDFAATGLSKTCHILDERIYELRANQFGRRRGCLAGELLRAFREYSGL